LLDELGSHGDSEEAEGFDYGLAAFFAGEARDEVLAFAEGFGEAVELGAVAEEVGAHGEDDVDGGVGAAGGGEEEVDEAGGFAVGGLAAGIAEEFFELVGDDEEAFAVVELGAADGFDEAEAAGAECFGVGGFDAGFQEGFG
jgi:hypothetical protein